MPEPTTDAPTFEEATAAAAENLRQAEEDREFPEMSEVSARVADRWLTLAALLKQ